MSDTDDETGLTGGPGGDPVMATRLANAARVAADLAAARDAGDAATVALLEALGSADGGVLLYRPERGHFGVALGDLRAARHLAVLVPGVGDQANLLGDWLPWARDLYAQSPATSVIVWKGYDNPPGFPHLDALAAAVDHRAVVGSTELVAFVADLRALEDQSLTLIAHSYGSVVVGEALAARGLRCTDVVVLGSPGLMVDDLRQLHMAEWHCFAEDAPEDVVAGLGAFGTDPASPLFGAVRMTTNADGRPVVAEHSRYFEPGSAALENIVHVVTGQYQRVAVQDPTAGDVVGGVVTLVLRSPFLPFSYWADHYGGPGATVVQVAEHVVNVVASGAGNLVRLGVDAAFRPRRPDPGAG